MNELQPGVMHPVDQAFYDLTVKERNYERVKVDRLEAEVRMLRRVLVASTNAEAFWDAVYPHITEDGPDLNFSDCEYIVMWLNQS